MNMILWPPDGDESRDTRIAGALSELDPGRDDPTYWLGFHGQVMGASRNELRRRRWADVRSVTGVVSIWSRAVVPLALAAAAVAGFLLARPVLEQDAPLFIEDVLSMGLSHPIPTEIDEPDVENPDWLVLTSEDGR